MPSLPPVHRSSGWRPSVHQQEYDKRRGSAQSRGYTAAWSRASKRYLQENPLCPGCRALGMVVPATLVDHIRPHRGDMALFWDHGNWQGACAWHHDVVKQRLERMRDHGQATVADLRLDSAAAVALTHAMRGAR